ncbi:ATPase [Mycobacteroides abscessus subsp. abscessus]|nr:ATPase [Mycobacteroides abscessus subsp. abscessus]
MMAKARAMSQGRYHVSMGDLRKAALPVLRHRLIVNFEADSSGISADEIIRDLVESRNPAWDGRQHA